MDDIGTTPAPAAPPVTDDAIAAAFMDAIEDLLDLDEREVMALRAREAALRAYAAGTLLREDAVEALGLRDYADLLVALGDAGLTPPRPPAHVIEEQAATFEALWRAEDPTP